MKRGLMLVAALLLFVLSPVCFANETTSSQGMDKPTIAVVVADYGSVRSNEKAIQIIKDKLMECFPGATYNLECTKCYHYCDKRI